MREVAIYDRRHQDPPPRATLEPHSRAGEARHDVKRVLTIKTVFERLNILGAANFVAKCLAILGVICSFGASRLYSKPPTPKPSSAHKRS